MPVSGAPLDRPVDVTDMLRRGLDAGNRRHRKLLSDEWAFFKTV
jgi:hypothetical protein